MPDLAVGSPVGRSCRGQLDLSRGFRVVLEHRPEDGEPFEAERFVASEATGDPLRLTVFEEVEERQLPSFVAHGSINARARTLTIDSQRAAHSQKPPGPPVQMAPRLVHV